MSKNKIPQTNSDARRDNFSSFVVDLRQGVKQVEKELKKEIKQIAPVIEKEFKSVKKQEKRLQKSFTIKQNILRTELKQDLVKVKHSFDWSFIRRRNAWPKTLAQKQRAFQKAVRLKFKQPAWQERAESAETKVVWYRSLLSFAFVLLLIIVPLKVLSYFEFFNLQKLEAKIISRSQLALNNLMAAGDSVSKLDFRAADNEFRQAGDNFLAAQEELNKINDSLLSLAALANDPKLKLAAESKKFLTAGAIASSLGRNLVLATDSLFNGDQEKFVMTLNNFSRYGRLAVSDAQALKMELSKINPDNLPANYQAKFNSLSKQANILSDGLASFVGAADKLQEFLGASQDKRYLLVFQNNSELRASGGFLGSYALVDVRDGKIHNLEVPGGGSYDTEAGMKVRVVAPRPLWLVNPLWHFWDANWWPDWPTTAKNLMWFYEKSDGPTVDGVISVTPTVVERLLEITGPIDLTKEYGLTIDANNFWETVQKVVEQKNLAKFSPEAIRGLPTSSTPIKSSVPLQQGLEVNAANKPKKIIGDLMAKILETLPSKLTKDNLPKIITLFEESMSEKQVLFYFTNPSLQAEVENRNYAGQVRETSRDYFLVVDTNIAGQKSDRKIVETIEHLSTVEADGSIINTLKISRAHTGIKNEPLVGVRNVDWLRVYVPEGSELISATGWRLPEAKYFDEQPEADWEKNPTLKNEEEATTDPGSGTKIYSENNKTVFANWVMVDPGETAVITLEYRLPFNFFAQEITDNWLKRLNRYLNPEQSDLLPYSLLIQKQPGAKPAEFSSRLVLPAGLNIFWRHPDSLIGTSGWEIKDRLNADKYYSVLLEKK